MALLLNSGGVDSFLAGVTAKENGIKITNSLIIDLERPSFSREKTAALKTANYFSTSLIADVSVAGIQMEQLKENFNGVPFTAYILHALAAARAHNLGETVVISGIDNNIITPEFLTNINYLLYNSALTSAVEIKGYNFSNTEIVNKLKSLNITKTDYWFATCNEATECGVCFKCKKKADILASL